MKSNPITETQLRAMFPNASASVLAANQTSMLNAGTLALPSHEDHPHPTRIPYAEPQRDQASALGAAVPGEETSVPRTVVRFVGYRVRPLDPDNFAGSVKDLLDGLRHARLIEGDEPWRITLQTEQVKVNSFKEERTVIEIEGGVL